MINIGLATYSDAWWTLIGLGSAAFVVIVVLLLMRWEAHHATTLWDKRNKKNGKAL